MRPRCLNPVSCALLVLVACGGNDAAGPSGPTLLLEIAGGNGQRAFVGHPTPEPLRVRVTFHGEPRPDIPIAFAVQTGDARLAADERQTNDSGVAAVALELGETPGAV